jgi:hypothetical protein
MTAQPLTIYNELFNDIHDFRNDLKQINSLKRMKLVSKAKDLKLEAYDYHDFLGMIFCLENNIELAIEHHRTALEAASGHFIILHNYFSTLSAFGFFSEAKELGEYILVNFPSEATEFKTVDFVIKNLLVSGRLQDAYNLLNKLEAPSEYPEYKVITEGLSIFKEVGLSDDEAEKISNCIFDVLHDKKLYLSDIKVSIVDDCLFYQIYVDLPIEEIFDINWDAADVLAERVGDMRSNIIMFQFNSVEILLEGRE